MSLLVFTWPVLKVFVSILKAGFVNSTIFVANFYLKSIISPATKLHITILVIKREPRDVYLTCGLEYPRWYVCTSAFVSHNHVGRKCPVKLLISAENRK